MSIRDTIPFADLDEIADAELDAFIEAIQREQQEEEDDG